MIALLLAFAAMPAGDGVATAQVAATRTLVIRTRGPGAAPPSPMPAYREHKGPDCIDAGAIAGAAVTAPDAIDLALKGGERVRAKLERACPALDFYRGFYVSPNPDGRICADRDMIRTRSGGECAIDRFRKLQPIPAKGR